MKPAVDEMFPEGAGPYVDLDEVGLRQYGAGRGGGSTARKHAREPRSPFICMSPWPLRNQLCTVFTESGSLGSKWSGLHNFEDLFDDDDVQ
ncbi:hypothetical protein U0070_000033 [Myodes glareolus]|uniref:COP9 signalosome complex subunit 9 n=1 Tax=Myodes glareolus TaxID=447135 RepID=A0AAW0HVC8_MYOGA